MEWSNTQAISVERLREPRFWQFRSGLYAFIHSSSGLLQWQSSSANSMEFLRDAYAKTPPGEEAFDNFSARGEEYFRYSYHVIWEDEYGVDFPLIFTLLSSQETYKAELFSFRKNIALWLGLAGILLLAIQLLVLRWGLAPMGRLARELRDLESGGRQHLSQRYPKELTGITRNLTADRLPDITFKRPIAGLFYKLVVPHPVSLTRKRDETWTGFLERIRDRSLVIMAPEGRMMRKNGLDKHGKPMTVKSGIAEVLDSVDGGDMLLAYAEGLHHIQAPGEGFGQGDGVRLRNEVQGALEIERSPDEPAKRCCTHASEHSP